MKVLNSSIASFALVALILVGCGDQKGESSTTTDQASASSTADAAAGERAQLNLNANQQKAAEPAEPVNVNAGTLKFQELNYDFGTIEEGDVAVHEFNFSVEGDYPVTINRVKTSCGCTASDFPKDKPVNPGESSTIKLTFDSKGKPGQITKTATVFSDSKGGNVRLTLTGTVNAAGEGPVK